MRKLMARDILRMSLDELWKLPLEEEILLTFDDGEIKTNTQETIISRYTWWPQAIWPKTPLLIEHHFNGDQLTSNLILEKMDLGVWKAYDTYLCDDPIDLTFVGHEYKRQLNLLHNDTLTRAPEYITSMTALDFLEVVDHPEIAEVNNTMLAYDFTDPELQRKSQGLIEEAHDTITEVMKRPGVLPANRVIENIKARILNVGQTICLVGPRGHLTDANSMVLPEPIASGFVNGLRNIYEMSIERLSAVKAAAYTETPLQQTEYFNRQLQLLMQVLERVADVDCGNKETMLWPVTKTNFNDLLGLNYMTDDGQWANIRKGSLNLIGTTIRLRTVVDCKYPHPNQVCSGCFGQLHLAFSKYDNVGTAVSAFICSMITQNVMSTKHLDGSAKVGSISLTPLDKRFIRADNERLELYILPEHCNNKSNIIVTKDQVANIADINLNKDIRVDVSKTTRMLDVTISAVDEDGDLDYHPVNTRMDTRAGSFSTEFLYHIRDKGMTTFQKNRMEIPLDGWDPSKPVWVIPKRFSNTLDFLSVMRKKIFTPAVKRKNGGDPVVECVVDLYETSLTKFPINVAHIALIVKCLMVEDPDNNNYHITKGSGRRLGKQSELMMGRGLGACLAWQDQKTTNYSYSSFIYKNRPYTPFDDVVCPTGSPMRIDNDIDPKYRHYPGIKARSLLSKKATLTRLRYLNRD